jgi:hypothetical protein
MRRAGSPPGVARLPDRRSSRLPFPMSRAAFRVLADAVGAIVGALRSDR